MPGPKHKAKPKASREGCLPSGCLVLIAIACGIAAIVVFVAATHGGR
jgi:hypothetical protein